MTITADEENVAVGYHIGSIPQTGSMLRVASDSGAAVDEYVSVKVSNMNRRDSHVAGGGARESRKVKRRLQGFLIEMGQDEAKVAFMDGETVHEYYLPASQLRDARITAENQPFEMDEVVARSGSETLFGYVFRPLARPEDAFADNFALDAERARKRARIFKAFGHAQD